MHHSDNKFFLVGIVLLGIIFSLPSVVVEATCLLTNRSGLPLPPVLHENGTIKCMDGFYCPLLNVSDPTTYPVSCPSDSDCTQKRAMGKRCATSQGLYEPLLVPRGHFSEDGRTIHRCPSGHVCVAGTKTPVPCAALSYCPEESFQQRPYGLLIFLCLGFAALFAIVFVYRARFTTSTMFTNLKNNDDDTTDVGSSTSHNDSASLEQAPQSSFGFLITSAASSPIGTRVRPFSSAIVRGGDSGSENESEAGDGSGTYSSVHPRSHLVQLLCNGFKRRRGGAKPLDFQFNNVRVAVTLAGGRSRTLLNDVSGTFAAGKVTAILGPSGSGKTTLMNTILGKLPDEATHSGHLSVRGASKKTEKTLTTNTQRSPTSPSSVVSPLSATAQQDVELSLSPVVTDSSAPSTATEDDITKGHSSTFSVMNQVRHMIGFVPQDDVLHTELSTYKNLFYSSEIRLPRDWVPKERRLFRTAVMDIMGLDEVRDVPIGDAYDRGISKSQRKRASIALELVAAPLAMFLDEPTSGLDSFASMELCLLLREIALQTKLCVAMVIHQPRSEIWNTLDEVMILAPDGYNVYQGPQQEAQQYFKRECGVSFPPEVNPADAIMDAVAERPTELVAAWKRSPLNPHSHHHHQQAPHDGAKQVPCRPHSCTSLPQPPSPTSPTVHHNEDGDEDDDRVRAFSEPNHDDHTAETGRRSHEPVTSPTTSSSTSGTSATMQKEHHGEGGVCHNPLLKQSTSGQYGTHENQHTVHEVPYQGQEGTCADEPHNDDDTAGWPGASFPRQVLLSHNRALEKQLSVMQPFIIEIIVNILSGLILGRSLFDFEHTAAYKDAYKTISIQPNTALLPQINLYTIMPLTLAGATAGVRVLGEPMLNYYRETAAGHSRLAFFLGSLWAATYRIIFCTYVFASIFYFLGGFGFSFGPFYYTLLASYFCLYALAAPISVLVSKKNAPLVASIIGLVCAIMSGFVDYPLWVKHLSFGFYTAQSIHLMHDEMIATAMDSTYEPWGYTDMHPGVASFICVCWGIIVYSGGCVLLLCTNKSRQR